MHIPLDREQDVPLYLQIEEALRRAILTGVFVDGDKLPSTRTLAAELAVSRLTVDNAYAELAAKGFCISGAAAAPMSPASAGAPGPAEQRCSIPAGELHHPHLTAGRLRRRPAAGGADQLRRRRRQP